MTRTAAWCGAVYVVRAPVAAALAAHALPNATNPGDIMITNVGINGDPFAWDRRRDLDMTNPMDRAPA